MPFSSESSPPVPVHLVAGGFPRGSYAGHDIDRVRLRLLDALARLTPTTVSVSPDYLDLEDWLGDARLLVSYVAGPFPDAERCAEIRSWLEAGGRWLAFHGTSGGKTVPLPDGRKGRMMARGPHHDLLGCLFLNHPPIRRFRVDVSDVEHPITAKLPKSFEVEDELYLLALDAPDDCRVLLTTSDLAADDRAPREFGFTYAEDTSVASDGRTRILAYERSVGRGAIVYIALGHCHTPTTNIQPWVDPSVAPDGKTPLEFAGPWETSAFGALVEDALLWGLDKASPL
jgi:type 1 glutamine amidotransferase